MAGSARQTVTDCSEDLIGRAWFRRSYTHISFVPPIRPITVPLNSHLSSVTAEVLKAQSWRVPKANWVFFVSPTGCVRASLVSKAVAAEFVPNEGVTAKMVRQCVHRDFEKSPTRYQTRSICPTSLIKDTLLTHNFPPNGRYSSCLPFLYFV